MAGRRGSFAETRVSAAGSRVTWSGYLLVHTYYLVIFLNRFFYLEFFEWNVLCDRLVTNVDGFLLLVKFMNILMKS